MPPTVVPPQQTSRFLNGAALMTLRHLRFTTRQRLEGTYSGRHGSSQQGGSGEFLDYREYVDGEDLRRLDWKVLARSGRAYVRLYVDEVNLHCTLAIDGSSSMLFNGKPTRGKGRDSTGSKLEYAQYVATAMSQVISAQQDQVGIGVIAGGLAEYLPPGGTAKHVLSVQQKIEGIVPHPESDLAAGLESLQSRLAHRGALVLMSDFLVDDLERLFASLRLFRHRKWEVVLIHLVHPAEERLPIAPAYRFEGMENEGSIHCSPAELAADYARRFDAHCAQVRSLAFACGCDYRRVSTTTSYLATLRSFLVERSS